MNILRKIGVSLSAMLLTTALFSVAWSSVAISTIHNRNTIKGWLDETNAYSRVVDIALEKLKTSKEADSQNLPMDDPLIQDAAKTAFSPEFLKEQVELVLNNVYSWLDGSVPTLSFSIDLSEAKQKLAAGIGAYVEARVAGLPVCATKSTVDFDGFTSICRPKALSATQAGQEVANGILTGKDFFQDTTLSSDDIKTKDSNGKEVPIGDTEQAKIVRTSYQVAGFAPLALGVLALLGALGVIFISRDHLAGVRRVGVVLLSAGVVFLVTSLALGALKELGDKKVNESTTSSAAEKALFVDMVKVVSDDIRSVLVKFTAGYLGVGVAAVAGVIILKKRRGGGDKKSAHVDMPKEAKSDEPSKSEAAVVSKPPEGGKPEIKVPVKKIDL